MHAGESRSLFDDMSLLNIWTLCSSQCGVWVKRRLLRKTAGTGEKNPVKTCATEARYEFAPVGETAALPVRGTDPALPWSQAKRVYRYLRFIAPNLPLIGSTLQ
jgi:hypothetical protein